MDINGVTLQVDFMDVDFMEKFEPALYEMQEGINQSKMQKGMVATGYRQLNQSVEKFFDVVWGEGVADSIFKGSGNVMLHIEAVAQISEAYKAEKKQFNDVSNKYTQRQNNFQYMQGHKPKHKPQGRA